MLSKHNKSIINFIKDNKQISQHCLFHNNKILQKSMAIKFVNCLSLMEHTMLRILLHTPKLFRLDILGSTFIAKDLTELTQIVENNYMNKKNRKLNNKNHRYKISSNKYKNNKNYNKNYNKKTNNKYRNNIQIT